MQADNNHPMQADNKQHNQVCHSKHDISDSGSAAPNA
jgi:hypothetical protein